MTKFSISKNKLWLSCLGVAIFSAVVISLFFINRESEKAFSPEKILSSNLAKDGSYNNEGKVVPKHPIKLLFVGDMMFDRYIREGVNKYGSENYNYIFEPIKDELAKYDLVVGNLEGPITDNQSVSVGTLMDEKNNFRFTFDPTVAKVLSENNIKLVNLGNNHILNQEEKGVEQTKKYLSEARVDYFGDTDGSEAKLPAGSLASRKEIGGNKIVFVNYNYSVAGSFERAIEEIKKAKDQVDVVILYAHWGTEYKVGDPGPSVRNLAHQFVDAGADLLIGTHPHVIEDSEVYNGQKIYYSLGNFIFDQYFQKETMEGMGVEVTINPDRSMKYNELKFEMTKRGQTKLMQNANVKNQNDN